MCQQTLRVVIEIDPAFPLRVDAWRRVPQCAPRLLVARGRRGGEPLCRAVADQRVVLIAGEGELIDIGGPADGPFGEVVNLTEASRAGASREAAATIERGERQTLMVAGDALGAAQKQRALVLPE